MAMGPMWAHEAHEAWRPGPVGPWACEPKGPQAHGLIALPCHSPPAACYSMEGLAFKIIRNPLADEVPRGPQGPWGPRATRRAGRRADRQTGRQVDRWTGGQADKYLSIKYLRSFSLSLSLSLSPTLSVALSLSLSPAPTSLSFHGYMVYLSFWILWLGKRPGTQYS